MLKPTGKLLTGELYARGHILASFRWNGLASGREAWVELYHYDNIETINKVRQHEQI